MANEANDGSNYAFEEGDRLLLTSAMLRNGILLADHGAQWIHNSVMIGSAQPCCAPVKSSRQDLPCPVPNTSGTYATGGHVGAGHHSSMESISFTSG